MQVNCRISVRKERRGLGLMNHWNLFHWFVCINKLFKILTNWYNLLMIIYIKVLPDFYFLTRSLLGISYEVRKAINCFCRRNVSNIKCNHVIRLTMLPVRQLLILILLLYINILKQIYFSLPESNIIIIPSEAWKN